MKFRGFQGEEVVITKRKDITMEHDHLIISVNGREVGYFHITEQGLDFFSIQGGMTPVDFEKEVNND